MAESSPLRVGLLMCGHVHPDAQDIAGDYPELFRNLLGPLGAEVVAYDLDQGSFPESTSEVDGWITSPSRQSVTDDDQWIVDAEDLLRQIIKDERPFAGICFGHQLLAQAMGGTVARADVGWGVGVKQYDVVAPRPWMQPPADHFRLVASHEDQVMTLPPGAQLLASSDYCPNAMFELGAHAIALQPHPEFTVELSARLVDLREDLIGAEAAAGARASYTQTPDRSLVAGWIVNFLRQAAPTR